MNRLPVAILFLLLVLSTLPSFAQNPPTPVDRGQEKTHKAKHEKTSFYAKDGKTLCGYLFESRSGDWYNYLADRMKPQISQRFETRDEAVAWMKLNCPIQGSVVLQ